MIFGRVREPVPPDLEAQRKRHVEALARADRVLAEFHEADAVADGRHHSAQRAVNSK